MRLKLAFLEENADIGGAEINVLNLISHLDPLEFGTLVICPKEGPLTQKVRGIGGRVAIVPRLPIYSTSLLIAGKKITNPIAVIWNLFSFFPSAWKLSRFLKSNQIQVVHTNSLLAHFYGGIACRLAGSRCLWHMQDIVDPSQGLGLFRKILNTAGAWLPHKIVVISKAVGEMFYGRSRKKMRLVYNGTDIKQYDYTSSGASIRCEFGIEKEIIVVGIVGRIVHWKGHLIFIKAAQKILRSKPKSKFLIVGHPAFGSQKFYDEVRKMSSNFGLDKAVIFTGYRKDIPDILSAIDILVNASTLPEPFGLTLIEAMACGKPIVATMGGGIPEIVSDEVTGRLVAMNDSEALANAILDFIDNPSKRTGFGMAGRKRVENYFSNTGFINGIAEEYRRLASRN